MLRQQFRKAVKDYRWFLRKDYPQKTSLQMVVTRHSLSAAERSMLFRGIMKKKDARARMKKIIPADKINNQAIHIDAFNVIYTLIAYLNGDAVYISDDGILRDASENHGKEIRPDLAERAVRLCLSSLALLKPKHCRFYIDQKMQGSGALEILIKNESQKVHLSIDIIYAESADPVMKNLPGIHCASSDTEIIDAGDHQIFDLARYILELNFSPEFLHLSKI